MGASLLLFDQTFLDGNGNPLSGGKIFTYVAGTTTLKVTWTDVNKTAANTNPIILDVNGRATIFGDGAYKIVVTDANDVVQYTRDGIFEGGGGEGWINLKELGAKGDGVTDDTLILQDALDQAVITGKTLYIPAGTYMCSGLLYNGPFKLIGDTRNSSIIRLTNNSGILFNATTTCPQMSGTSLTDIQLRGPGRTVSGGAKGWKGRVVTVGISASNREITFNRVLIQEFNSVGIEISDTFNVTFLDCRFINCGDRDLTSAGDPPIGGGIKLTRVNFGDVSSTGNLLMDCYFAGCDAGIFTEDNTLDQVLGMQCIKVFFENNNYGIWFRRSSLLRLDNCYFEGQNYKAVVSSQLTALSTHRFPPTENTTDGYTITGQYIDLTRRIFKLSYSGVDVFNAQINDLTQYIDNAVFNSGALKLGTGGESRFYTSSGSPQNVITADRASICIDKTTSNPNALLWIKTSNNTSTGWVSLISSVPAPLSGNTNQRPDAGDVPRGTPFYNSDNVRVEWSNGISLWRQYNGLTTVTSTLSNLPTGIEGARFYASDLNMTLQYDGARWRQMTLPIRFVTVSDGGTTTIQSRGEFAIGITTGTTISTHTLELPSGANAVSGDRARFATSRGITSLLVVSSATVFNPPVSMSTGSNIEFVYNDVQQAWYKVN